MCINEPFICAKFQLDWYLSSCIIAENVNVQNEEEKKNIYEILLAHILGFAASNLKYRLKFGYICRHENYIFFLPVNILMVCHAAFLGCMTLPCNNH